MIRHILLSLTASAALLTLGGCKGDESYSPAPYIGMDQVTRLELSPSSPVLAPDGKSGLAFMVQAFYSVGDEEVAMLQDRIDPALITITSSDGKTFGLGDVYSTTAAGSEVSFTAKTASGITSLPVSVRLIDKEPVVLPRITVPVRFHLMYTKQEKTFADQYTDEHFASMLDRLNRVFDGTIQTSAPRPYQVDAGVKFTLESVKRNEITLQDAEDTNDFVKEWLSKDRETVLHIWVSNNHEGWSSGTIQPWATFGNPDDIPFSDDEYLEQIWDLSADMEPWLEYTDYGITLNYGDLLSENAPAFAQTIGTYFALLSGSVDFRDYAEGDKIPDADFMSDTYTFDLAYNSPVKRARTSDTGQYIYYRSTNIMEGVTGQTISPEQARRLRQAMTDIPYRQQGFKN